MKKRTLDGEQGNVDGRVRQLEEDDQHRHRAQQGRDECRERENHESVDQGLRPGGVVDLIEQEVEHCTGTEGG